MGFPIRHIKAHKAHPTPIFPPIISLGFSQYLPAEFHPPNTLGFSIKFMGHMRIPILGSKIWNRIFQFLSFLWTCLYRLRRIETSMLTITDSFDSAFRIFPYVGKLAVIYLMEIALKKLCKLCKQSQWIWTEWLTFLFTILMNTPLALWL